MAASLAVDAEVSIIGVDPQEGHKAEARRLEIAQAIAAGFRLLAAGEKVLGDFFRSDPGEFLRAVGREDIFVIAESDGAVGTVDFDAVDSRFGLEKPDNDAGAQVGGISAHDYFHCRPFRGNANGFRLPGLREISFGLWAGCFILEAWW
jgi:hypothetical protein